MARIDAVLDDDVDYGFEGGARYKTDVQENPNGFTERDSGWKYGKHEFEASFGDIPDERRDRLVAILHVLKGREHACKFRDWNDYEIIAQPLQVGEVGTTDPIQLYQIYQPEGWPAYTIRPIQALEWAELKDEDGVLVPGTWDLNTGIFTPTNPWTEQAYTVDADFYVWVVLDDDYNPVTINAWRNNTAKLRFLEDPFHFTCTNVPESWSAP